MATIQEGIRDLLVAGAVGAFNATDGWNICISRFMDKPDTSIVIRRTGGMTPNPKWLIDYPSIQVIVRGSPSGAQAAEDKVQEVKDALLGLPSQDLNGDRWVQINMLGDYVDIGQDELHRPRFSVNFHLIIEPAASADTNRLPLSP